jgi:hypothetical protein
MTTPFAESFVDDLSNHLSLQVDNPTSAGIAD